MSARTLFEAFKALEEVADRGPVFLREGAAPLRLSFAQLMRRARHVQAGLQEAGQPKGARVGLVVNDNVDFIVAFVGAVMAGAVPVPAAAASALTRRADHAAALASMFGTARIQLLIASRASMQELAHLPERIETLRRLVVLEDLCEGPFVALSPVRHAPEDPCFLQFTSGSTAAPKGVVVTHANLAANARAIAVDALRLDPCTDIGVSWLPLHHDMGLVGNVLTALLYQIPVVYLSTLQFVKNPRIWMKAVSEHRGTVTFGPNFALALAARRADRAYVEGLDLRALRTLGCGAEPISAEVLRHFATVFAPAGFRACALRPCYGMAEATLAISFGRAGRPPRTETLQRAALEVERFAGPPTPGADDACVESVSCGLCLPGHAVDIVAANGVRLAENHVGEIVFRGPSVSQGYDGNSEATREVFREGALHTGDLGFMRDGELFIVGRSKDLVIIHGRNYSPQDIEQAVEAIEGVRMGGVAAFSVNDRHTERLVVVAETRAAAAGALVREIKDKVAGTFGIGRLEVALIMPGRLPRTTSGKIRRDYTRRLYQAGSFGPGSSACRNIGQGGRNGSADGA